MTDHAGIGARLNRVVVCHPEGLLAAAAAALLTSTGTAFSTVAVDSMRLLLTNLRPGVDVVVLLDQPEEDIERLFDSLRRRGLATPVLVLTPHPSALRAAELLELGAAGSLLADCSPAALCDGVVAARNGGTVLDPGLREDVLQVLRARRWQRDLARRRLAGLNAREHTAMQSLADGMSVGTIAAGMSISPHTVRGYLRTLGTKIGASGQLRIAAAARDLLAAAREPAAGAQLEIRVGGCDAGTEVGASPERQARLMHFDMHGDMHVDATIPRSYVPPLA